MDKPLPKILNISPWFVLVLTIISLGFITSCASTGELLAGPKDTTPPKIDSLLSTPNYQVHFKKQDVFFQFDEFIVLKDAYKQVLVSPPLVYLPKVKGKGKKVIFSFNEKEELRPNVTYTINFGESITDFREGNKLDNFSFVFSTGDVLDSLSISGIVYDAKTLKPAENAQVLLYDVFYDSIVVKEKPYYAVKTDKAGKFICNNIKQDTFKIIALVDKNVNLTFDLPTEMIGFLDTLVYIQILPSPQTFEFFVSAPLPQKKLLSKNLKAYGVVELVYNKPVDSIFIEILDKDVQNIISTKADSVWVYYTTSLDSFKLVVDQDTIMVKPPSIEALSKLNKFSIQKHSVNLRMLASDSLVFQFSFPVKQFNKDKIMISDTIGVLENIEYKLLKDQKSLVVLGNWRANMPYTIQLDSGSVVDWYDRTMDSIRYPFRILPSNQLSGGNFIFEKFDSTQTYHIRIMKEEKVLNEFSFQNTTTFEKKIKYMVPDIYTVEIIQDDNQNGVWDPANYWTKSQPEKMKIVQTNKLEVNRENEIRIGWESVSFLKESRKIK
ncbi:MAG: Ig-like domain-containing protein [Saprospiraceae bacterium]